MRVIASVAISIDGYMDDTSSQRLILSNSEDWEQVHELRATCDAILVGGQTLRADNPSLTIKDQRLRDQRTRRGVNADITKVVISASANLDPTSRFFSVGGGSKIVIVDKSADPQNVTELKKVATVMTVERITAQEVVRVLSDFGIETLMVEGGARTMKMFLEADMVDSMRVAVAQIKVCDHCAPRLNGFERLLLNEDQRLKKQCEDRRLGEVTVSWFERADIHYMKMAIDASRLCVPCSTCYRVGAVIVTAKGEIFSGYTHQSSPTNHAEEEAMKNALSAGADLQGAAIYSSIEPCSTRKSKPKSCSALIIEHKFSKAIFALYEPNLFVECIGAQLLRDAGVEVKTMEQFADDVRKINSHII